MKKNLSHLEQITYDFGEIRKTIQKFQENADSVIIKTQKKVSDGVELFSETHLRERLVPSVLNEARNLVNAEREIAQIGLRVSFDDIRAELSAWTAEPIPDSFSSTISFISQNNIALSKSEVEILRDCAFGSYFASKLLASMAETAGLTTAFVDLDTITRRVREAQGEAQNAITNYFGKADIQKGTLSGDFLADGEIPQQQAFVAQDLLGRQDNILDNTQKMITAAMSPTAEVGLSEGRRQEIDALFAECADDEARIHKCAEILSSDTGMDWILRTYDEELYRKSLNQIIHNAHAEALTARANADDVARQAAKQSADAERRKTH